MHSDCGKLAAPSGSAHCIEHCRGRGRNPTDGAAGLEVRDNDKKERNTRAKTLAPTQGR